MDNEPTKKKGVRVALTKTQAAEALGNELIHMSRAWLADGKLDARELDELKAWLAKAPADGLPAIGFLREEVQRYIADGEVYSWELGRLQASLIRVIPPSERQSAKEARSDAARVEWEKDAPYREASRRASRERSRELRERYADEWSQEPATEAQLAYARDLGGNLSATATKLDASETIDRLLAGRDGPSQTRFGCLSVITIALILTAGIIYWS